MVVTGSVGILKVGYREAAQIKKWQLVYAFDTMNCLDSQLTAFVKSANEFWATERVTRLGLQLDADVWWVWSTFELTSPIARGKSLTAAITGIPTITTHF